jgi:hypothetical protein
VTAPVKAPAIVRRLIELRLKRLQERRRKIIEEQRPACETGSATEEFYHGVIVGLATRITSLQELLEIPELADDGGEA